MKDQTTEPDLLRLGATYAPYGRLSAIHTMRGERYYAFVGSDGRSVTLLPARLFNLTNKPEEQTDGPDRTAE